MSEMRDSPERHIIQCTLVATTSAIITISAYGRMTGFDSVFHLVSSSRVLADVLFAIIVAFSAATSARMLRGVKGAVIYVAAISVLFITATAILLVTISAKPSEWLRFFAAPAATAALPLLGVLNLYLSRGSPICGSDSEIIKHEDLVVGAIGFTLGVVGYVASNLLGIKGFFLQNVLILLITIVPFIALLTALSSLAQSRRLASSYGAVLAIAAGGFLVALTTL